MNVERLWDDIARGGGHCLKCAWHDRYDEEMYNGDCLAQSPDHCPGVKAKLKEMERDKNAIQSLDAKAK